MEQSEELNSVWQSVRYRAEVDLRRSSQSEDELEEFGPKEHSNKEQSG